MLTQTVLSYRLDDFVRQFQLPMPTHMKIDVDGSELLILQGAASVLARPQLRSILLEVDDTHKDASEILSLLERHGFAIHSRRKQNILFHRR